MTMLQIYVQRSKIIEDVCKELKEEGKYGEYSKQPLSRMRWLHSHGLVMCFNAKVKIASII